MKAALTRFAAALVLASLLCVPLPVRGHEGHDLEEDVVCGMKIKREDAAGKADFQGQIFYFCSKQDQATFEASPDRYAGFLALTRVVEGRGYLLAVKPRRPLAGDEVTMTLTLPRRAWVSASAASTVTTPPLEALFFDLDREHEETGRGYFHLPPGSSPGSYTMGRFVREPGFLRMVVFVPRPDGAVDEVPFGFAVEPRPAAALAANPAPMGRPEPAGLSMEAQHETMRVIGRAWYELAERITAEPPRWDEARERLERMLGVTGRMPGFELHKFPKDKQEFLGYAHELALTLERYRSVLEQADAPAARAAFAKIDGETCTRCHLKFRWGVVTDLSRFPDLRIHPREGSR